MSIKHLTVRIEEKLLNKFHVVAKSNQRSVNQQIIIMIKMNIQAYEAKHGEIE